MERPPIHVRIATVLAAAVGMAVVAWIDHSIGIEYRIYPLYFVPLSAAAVVAGRSGAVIASLVATGFWISSNLWHPEALGSPRVLILNALSQLAAFLTVGLLLSSLHLSVRRERWSSHHDALTGLRNSRGFFRAAEEELERNRRYARPFTLAYLDLDGFKQVNDAHGHAFGDTVLQAVAASIREATRTVDVAARLGGDEFGLLMPETDIEGARQVLERLRATLEAAMRSRGLDVTASIGAISYDGTPPDLETMLQRADAQMYRAKTAGKNRVLVEAPSASPEDADVGSLPMGAG